MNRCAVKPYEGNENYIFISYSHQDKQAVFPIIERLVRDGYRVWYDEGIDPGSEWPEIIATYLNGCSLCIACISENSLNSHNCRREINFALSKKKPFISVMLEPIEMSLGMEMQLSSTQSVFKYAFQNEDEFFAKLYNAKSLSSCCRVTGASEIKATDAKAEQRVQEDSDSASEKEFGNEKEPSHSSTIVKKEKSPEHFAPVIEDEKKTEPVHQTSGRAEKKRKKVIVAAVLFGLGIAALFIGFHIFGSVTIGEKKVSKRETSVILQDEILTVNDMKAICSVRNLKYLSISDCVIDDDAMKYFSKISAPVTNLILENCTGWEDCSSISDLVHLNRLAVTECDMSDGQLRGIRFENLSELNDIDLSGNAEVSDIAPLAALEKLEKLTVDRTAVHDFSALKECRNLQNVSAQKCGLTDTDISTLTNETIRYLYLNHNEISDIAELAKLEALSTLELNDNKIKDIEALSAVSSLADLQLNDNQITSLVPLSDAEKLGRLYIKNNKLKNLDGLEHSLELTELLASGNEIENLDGLTNCTVLEMLNINENKVSDISVLAKSAGTLLKVWLNDNRVSDISCLEGAVRLWYLSLDGNQVTTLDALSKCTSLAALSAESNGIDSIEGLSAAEKLQYLYLADNKISDMTPVETLASSDNKYRMDIDLSCNQIAEIKIASARQYVNLFLYNNPIKDFQKLADIQGYTLWFSYREDMNVMGMGHSFSSYNLLDCPLDKQVPLKEEMFDENEISSAAFTFCTVEEAEQQKEERKTAVFADPAEENVKFEK